MAQIVVIWLVTPLDFVEQFRIQESSKGRFYTVRFCRTQPPYDTKKSRRILKHVLKPYDSKEVEE